MTHCAVNAASLLSLCVAILAASPIAAQGKAHAHGLAELHIVIEGRTGMLDFTAPAEDVYGFERDPRTPAERERRVKALGTLRHQISDMVVFDASLGCTIIATAVHAGNDSHAHDDKSSGHVHGMRDERGRAHVEVHGEYTLQCARAPAGRDIRFGFTKHFPSIKTVQVQLRADDEQAGRRIENDRGTVRP